MTLCLPPADYVRCDRSTLRRSESRDDGSVVYEAILSRADVALSYPWGQEVATEEALSSPAYLAGLEGLPVVALHPGAGRVDIADPGTYDEVGTVLGARWDADERHVVIRLVVRRADALSAVKAGQTGVSEGYTVPHLDATVQPARQLARIPNHVALTLSGQPRMPGAHIRADSGAPMTIDQIRALLEVRGVRADSESTLTAGLDALIQRAKEADASAEDAATRADAAEGTLTALGLEVGADSATLAKRIADSVREVAAIRADAADLGVELPADEVDPAALRVALARALGAPAERVDSVDTAAVWVDAIRVSRKAAPPAQSAASRMAAGATARTDSDSTRF